MIFEEGQLYHLYNQGNNKQVVFFCKENYWFFLQKIKTYIAPYADIIAWCLMPNHFHLMVKVNFSHRVTSSHPVTNRSFNQSIAILLRSYTRAINKQENKTGSLFREGTKAECIAHTDGITPSFYNTNKGTLINIENPEKQYPRMYFEYIHQNPVKAGLVKRAVDLDFSSARDYEGTRNGKLVNKPVANEYIDI